MTIPWVHDASSGSHGEPCQDCGARFVHKVSCPQYRDHAARVELEDAGREEAGENLAYEWEDRTDTSDAGSLHALLTERRKAAWLQQIVTRHNRLVVERPPWWRPIKRYRWRRKMRANRDKLRKLMS